MRLWLNALPSFCFLLFGLVMIYGSITMEPSFSGTNEHRWVPLGMSIFVSLLAVLLLVGQVLGTGDDAEIRAHSFFWLVIPCVLLLAAYTQASIWFGYGAATFVSGILIFRMFQNSWVASLIQSVIATLVLYVIFFKLLKLYNPPGRWLDLPLPF